MLAWVRTSEARKTGMGERPPHTHRGSPNSILIFTQANKCHIGLQTTWVSGPATAELTHEGWFGCLSGVSLRSCFAGISSRAWPCSMSTLHHTACVKPLPGPKLSPIQSFKTVIGVSSSPNTLLRFCLISSLFQAPNNHRVVVAGFSLCHQYVDLATENGAAARAASLQITISELFQRQLLVWRKPVAWGNQRKCP